MPQELRSILFTADEVRVAVTRLLLYRIRGLRPSQVDHVEIRLSGGAVHGAVRFSKELNAQRALEPNELMSAVLMYCRQAGIPLSNRSEKRLGVIDGCLSLTTSLNAARIDPWIVGDRVIHSVADPLLLSQHFA